MSLPIQLHDEGERGYFFYENQGSVLAKMIFCRQSQNTIVIEPTEAMDVLHA
jgi:hypothetical protein